MAASWDMHALKTVDWRRRALSRLLARDGFLCWLCGKLMVREDATIGHLVAPDAGGSDELANLVLCHSACNKRLANRPLEQKVRMRDRRRRKPTRRRRSASKSR